MVQSEISQYRLQSMALFFISILCLTSLAGADTLKREQTSDNTSLIQGGGLKTEADMADDSGDASPKISEKVSDQNSDSVPVTDVEVTDTKEGSRNNQVQAGPLGEQDSKSMPYSINTVTSGSISNSQAQSSSDALKYIPTVQNTTGGSRVTDYYVIRGFTSSVWTNNTAVDGMKSYDNIEPIEDKEKIEVLSGANGLIYGITSPGGMINYITKRPTDTPLTDITVGDYGGAQAYVHGDFGGPLDENKKLDYRLNVLYVDNGEVGIEHQTNQRDLISGALDWHLNSNTQLSFDAVHFYRDLEYSQALFMVGSATSIPDAPDSSKNWGAPYSFTKDEINKFGMKLDSKLNEVFTLRSAFRYGIIEREFATYREKWVNDDYDYKLQVNYQGNYQTVTRQGNLFLDAQFATGIIQHKASLGWSGDDVEYRYPLNGTKTYTSTATYLSNLTDPDYVTNPDVIVSSGSPYRTTEKTNTQSKILVDQMTFNDFWSVLIGGNYAQIDDQNCDLSTGIQGDVYNKGKFTPSAAILYRPVSNITIYTSYVEALQKGLIAASTAANAGEIFEPYVSTQYEVGLKTRFGGIDLNVAVFSISQANAYTDPGTNISSPDGREVNKGAELTLNGKVTKNLTLGGGLTVLDAEVKKASTVSIEGKIPQGVAEQMARIYADYTLPWIPDLAITSGLSYTGKEWVDSQNTLSIPAVFTGDMGIRYQMKMKSGHNLIWRLTVNNIANTDYWTTRSGILYLGNPRTTALSAEMKL
ncbi:MAG TPA: TonB-dependent siderophore receptor [Firmicutes bacterium]|jgi:iron complex outermembrane recepter protein|nr:TonB-dependent siderophore receptor [Bacillota bacterium]